jgi:hypothetical protein
MNKLIFSAKLMLAVIFGVITTEGYSQWFTSGNSLTGTLPSSPTEWLGSINGGDLVFKTTNAERFRISTTATAASPMLWGKAPALASAGEYLLNLTVSDAPNDYLRVINGTGGNSNFYPAIVGYKGSSSVYCPALAVIGSVPASMDYSPMAFDPGPPIISVSARRDFGVGGGTAIVNRPIFGVSNFTSQYFMISANGHVGINTNYPSANLTVNGNVVIGDPMNVCIPNANYKLFVETGILTEKVKVAINCSTDWADYVFARNYNLRSIAELEKFVIENHHLPNIPSADEVVKEGIDVATMDARLLEKIEELSLYIIQLKNENEKLEQRVQAIEKK